MSDERRRAEANSHIPHPAFMGRCGHREAIPAELGLPIPGFHLDLANSPVVALQSEAVPAIRHLTVDLSEDDSPCVEAADGGRGQRLGAHARMFRFPFTSKDAGDWLMPAVAQVAKRARVAPVTPSPPPE